MKYMNKSLRLILLCPFVLLIKEIQFTVRRDVHIWNQTNSSKVYSKIHTVKLRFPFRTFIQKSHYKSEGSFISALKSPPLLDLISKLFPQIQFLCLKSKKRTFLCHPLQTLNLFYNCLDILLKKSIIIIYAIKTDII